MRKNNVENKEELLYPQHIQRIAPLSLCYFNEWSRNRKKRKERKNEIYKYRMNTTRVRIDFNMYTHAERADLSLRTMYWKDMYRNRIFVLCVRQRRWRPENVLHSVLRWCVCVFLSFSFLLFPSVWVHSGSFCEFFTVLVCMFSVFTWHKIYWLVTLRREAISAMSEDAFA